MAKTVVSIVGACLCCAGWASAQPATRPVMRFEAEDATLVNVERKAVRPGFSGEGYVTGIFDATSRVQFDVKVPAAGFYDLSVRYSSPGGIKGYYYSVNGERFEDYLPGTGEAFATRSAGRVELREGRNTIAIEKYWGYHDVDYIELCPVPKSVELAMVKPPKTLSDPDASEPAKRLMGVLVDGYGERTLSGVYSADDSAYTKDVVGRVPAIMGGDLMDYSPSRVERGADAKGEVERLIKAHGEGQIVTLSWHWNAPRDLLDRMDTDAQGKPVDHRWYRGFYTEATTFDVSAALADKNSEAYGLLLRDIDAIAVQLKKLEAAGVPVLWRPLHEAEGRWFWWGAKGSGPFVELWRLMHERLTKKHGLHNLIWVYTSGGDATWYPGDAYVDVVGVDCYPPATDDPLSALWENLSRQFAGKKVLAVSEFGGVPDVTRMHRFGAKWAYFVSWSGNLGPKKNKADELKKIYGDPKVVTLEGLRGTQIP